MPEITLKPQLKLTVFNDMSVLSDPETGAYYRFNVTAGPVLQALAEGASPSGAAVRLAEAYSISSDLAEGDVDGLLDQLEAEDLLSTVPAADDHVAAVTPPVTGEGPARRRIVFLQELQHLYPLGGTAKVNRRLMEQLVQAGYELSVFCDIDTPPTRAMLGCLWAQDTLTPVPDRYDDAIEFDVSGVRLLALTENDLPTFEQVQRLEPEAILLSEDRTFARHRLAAEFGVPLVWLATRPATLPFGRHAWNRSEEATEIFLRAEEIVVPNHFMAEYVRTWTGRTSRVVPSPLFAQPRAGTPRRDGFITIFNPSAIKGVSLFEQLAAALPQQRFAAVPGWSTTPDDFERLKAIANVTVIAPDREVTAILDRTSVLVAPSLWSESPGLIVSEAMLRGIPSVVAAVGSLPEAKLGVPHVLPVDAIEAYTQLEDARGAQVPVVPEQSPAVVERWTETLSRLLDSEEHWLEVSRASQAAAAAQAAADRCADTITDVVSAVLAPVRG